MGCLPLKKKKKKTKTFPFNRLFFLFFFSKNLLIFKNPGAQDPVGAFFSGGLFYLGFFSRGGGLFLRGGGAFFFPGGFRLFILGAFKGFRPYKVLGFFLGFPH